MPNADEEADAVEDDLEENKDSDADSDFEAPMRRPAVFHVNRHVSSSLMFTGFFNFFIGVTV